MTVTSHSGPDPLAAVPLLAEAGVSVYWQQLEGRTAWVADADTREVWISRSVPRDAVLRALVEALGYLDEATERAPAAPAAPRLVHSAAEAEQPRCRDTPALRVVRDG